MTQTEILAWIDAPAQVSFEVLVSTTGISSAPFYFLNA